MVNLNAYTEKYITLSIPVKKEIDNVKTITCKLKFIDRFRFMSRSLSSFVNNQKFTAKCVECVEKEIKLNHYLILLDLKIINYIINATYIKKDG